MANNIHELAKEALDNGNYQLAVELFECILQISDKLSTTSTAPSDALLIVDAYIGYGDSLARCGRIHDSFDVFVFICTQLGYAVPLDKLKQLTIGLLDSVASTASTMSSVSLPSSSRASRRHSSLSIASNSNGANDAAMCSESKHEFGGHQVSPIDSSDRIVLLENSKCCTDIDPFTCPVCNDVLVSPVTIVCGHTYCRDCVYDQSHCYVCGKALQLYGSKCKQDVLIGRLIEKWWTPLLQARIHNDEAERWLQQNGLDQALKSCNASLEKSKYRSVDTVARKMQIRVFTSHHLSQWMAQSAGYDDAVSKNNRKSR